MVNNRRKLLAVLLSLPAISFCQNDGQITTNAFTERIDSIAREQGRHFIAEGTANVKEGDIIIAKGGTAYGYYLYFPYLDKWKKLPASEKRLADYTKGQKLIKGEYNEVLHYDENHGGYSEQIFVELYYQDTELFYARVTIKKYKRNTELERNVYEYPVLGVFFKKTCCPTFRSLSKTKTRQYLNITIKTNNIR